MQMYTAEFYSLILNSMMLEAARARQESVEISAADLLGRFSDYPGKRHQVPDCCKAMRAALAPEAGDKILEEPPEGQEVSLRIRYVLPRRAWGL
jgi:hypothetical protein